MHAIEGVADGNEMRAPALVRRGEPRDSLRLHKGRFRRSKRVPLCHTCPFSAYYARSVRKLATGNLDPLNYRHNLICQHVERLQLVNVGHAENGLIDAKLLCLSREYIDGGAATQGVVASIARDRHHVERRFLDLVVIAAQ